MPLSVLQRSQAGLHLAQVVSALDIRTTVDEASERESAIQDVIDLICDGSQVTMEMAPMVAKGATKQLRRADADASEVTVEEVFRLAAKIEESVSEGDGGSGTEDLALLPS